MINKRLLFIATALLCVANATFAWSHSLQVINNAKSDPSHPSSGRISLNVVNDIGGAHPASFALKAGQKQTVELTESYNFWHCGNWASCDKGEIRIEFWADNALKSCIIDYEGWADYHGLHDFDKTSKVVDSSFGNGCAYVNTQGNCGASNCLIVNAH